MSKRKKNKIFEDLTADAAAADLSMAEDALAPVVSDESLVENVPDSDEQISKLEEQLSEMSRLQAELNVARQRTNELEAEVKRLQSDNDMLVMKLAENAAAQANIPQQQAQQSSCLDTRLPNMKTNNKPMSKRVQYNYPNYGNNGYGTWH